MALLPVGAPAPDLEARTLDGRTVRLRDLAGSWVVLYFYPKDRTYNCTREACGFRDAYESLRAAGVNVIGVSRDDAASHEDFAHRQRLPFPLVADPRGEILEAYGTKAWYGVARRVTYLINPEGRVAKVYPHVRAGHHAQDVVADLRRLRQESDKLVLETNK